MTSQGVSTKPESFVCLISILSVREQTSSSSETQESGKQYLDRRALHTGIHVVIAAQNPTIEAMQIDMSNFRGRVAFNCAKSNYSTTILGDGAAKHLSGKGALYFKSPLHDGLKWAQGAFITEDELTQAISEIKTKPYSDNDQNFIITDADLQGFSVEEDNGVGIMPCKPTMTQREADDKLLAEIMLWSLGCDSISGRAIDRKFHMNFDRAKFFLETLRNYGIADESLGTRLTKILPRAYEDLSTEVLAVLSRNGHTEEDINEAFALRLIKTI